MARGVGRSAVGAVGAQTKERRSLAGVSRFGSNLGAEEARGMVVHSLSLRR